MFRSIITPFIIVFCIPFFVFAQTPVDSISLRLDFGDKQAIPVYNKENGELALFVNDGDNIYSYLYNDADEMIKSYRFDKSPNRQITEKQAILLQDGLYVIYKSDPLRTTFESHSYDLNNNNYKKYRFDIHLTDEYHLKSIVNQGHFYIFTVGKKSNLVYVYEFDTPSHYEKHKFDLSTLTASYGKTFFEMVRPTKSIGNYSMGNDIMLIHEGIATSLKTAGFSKKLYYNDNHFQLSIDQRKQQKTLVFDFDMGLKTCDLYDFKISQKSNGRGYSSYLYEDLLYQINVKENAFIVETHQWPDGHLQETFSFPEENLHPADHLNHLKNLSRKKNKFEEAVLSGAINQATSHEVTSGTSGNLSGNLSIGLSRDTEIIKASSERMLKQASRGDVNIVVNKNAAQENIMTFGASENGDFKILGFAAASLAIAGPLGGLAAGSGKHTYYKGDPAVEEFYSLLNYENGIYQEQKINENREIDSEVPQPNPFLKISEHIQSLKDIRGKSAFCLYRKKDIYYLGYYDKYEKQYFIVKFDS